ncbi:MAG: helix-turn-helix transcriptional regulator [Ruminococcus bromii]|uniref:helix-turn-helix domain-containing protein n=1 Tax=Ruminococcus sp. YE282 TaxID=3158780 RepID=UPI0008923A90|nr:helix-turn-helix transcriptional regulator [Ruminococcus bromii]MCI7211679.1 helix-turn-helix transcriptional regulator [Ruminococcus bromii]MDY4085053.1 helix-turn-helix transcriptional regulator [Ruminococcus bromii]MEE3499258.1 helix-turn-helix transcriptional regulator [Ruminococcus bromii]SCY19720.1 Helix-turn-helix [Ruminococcus bromii]
MNKDFPRIITFLRKERGLSQKQVAADLGISQALLSHYEKGIRECGLDFLVRAAEYFEVSCDYLLGRTVQRRLAAVTADDIPESDEIRHIKGNMINQINKKLLMNTTTVIFDLLAQIGDKRLTNAVSNYLMSAEYQIFRTIYCSEENNTQSMFSITKNRYKALTSASMMLDLEIIDSVIERNTLSLSLSPDIISTYFKGGAASLFNLIQLSERNIKGIAQHKNLA